MQKILPHILLLSANIFYGINYTVAKIVMPDYVKPFGFILLRSITAFLFFSILVLLLTDINNKIDKKDFIRLLGCGIFGVCVNQLCFFKGLQLTTPIQASIIMTITPVLVVMLSYFILKLHLTKEKIIGIILGLIGAILLIFNLKYKSTPFAPNPLLGNFLIIVNASSYAFYLILAKPLLLKYHPILVLKWIFAFGLILVIPFGYNDILSIKFRSFTTEVFLALFFVLLFVSCLAYLFNIISLKKLNPSTVAIYIYSQPLFSILFAIITGYDTLNSRVVLAGIFIFLGVYLVNKSNFIKI